MPRPRFMIDIVRDRWDDNGTEGELLFDRRKVCHTIERPWRGNARWESCIPEGRYHLRVRNGAAEGSRFRYLHLVIEDVPDRSHILIHPANRPENVTGCVGVGNREQRNWVSNSFAAFNELMILAIQRSDADGRGGVLQVSRLDADGFLGIDKSQGGLRT